MASALDYMFQAHQRNTSAGLGNFIREKLNIARKAGLTRQMYQEMGNANATAATAAQDAKLKAFAPLNQQVLEQMYGTGTPGKYDFTKPNITMMNGRPVVGNVTSSSGMILPKYSTGGLEDAISEMIRRSSGGGFSPFSGVNEVSAGNTPVGIEPDYYEGEESGLDPQTAALLLKAITQ
jgi:hypothetical protein